MERVRPEAMNPTAADFLQALQVIRSADFKRVMERAQELAAARQTDSVEKVIADMRKDISEFTNVGIGWPSLVSEYTRRLEAIGKEGVK